MKGIISLGEALIDFTPYDGDNTGYIKNPGGAPANVAVATSKLGVKSSFLGSVGNDIFGEFLRDTLKDEDVIVDNMVLLDDARTGLVFVNLDKNGERTFHFYIKQSADTLFSAEHINKDVFKENKILHFGSISLINEPTKSATLECIKLAKENNMLISYDPNLRLMLWKDEETARETIKSVFEYVDIMKISDDELEFLTGERDIKKGLDILSKYNIPIVFITCGADGSYVYTKDVLVYVESIKVDVVDTTGAGDAFVSGILYNFNQIDMCIKDMREDVLREILQFANISGALATTKKGAMTALPTLEEIKEYINMYY